MTKEGHVDAIRTYIEAHLTFEFAFNAVAVFIGVLILDLIYGEYTKASADRRIWSASINAALLVLPAGFVAISYIADPALLLFSFCGAFVGTWISIRYGK